ncbi:hypothetical protein, partial [Mycobacterium tuberculosis]|uniref:hypothetical protein n=1 Tax=Mycobacterium tuberculosis TaxID=1773 RepID=UPI00254BB5CA
TTWGVLIDFKKIRSPGEDIRPEDSDYNVNVLTRCVSHKEMGAKKSTKIVPLIEPGEAAVVSLPLSEVDSLSSIRLFIPKDLLPQEAR